MDFKLKRKLADIKISLNKINKKLVKEKKEPLLAPLLLGYSLVILIDILNDSIERATEEQAPKTKTHKLKVSVKSFSEIAEKKKNTLVRINDCDFKVDEIVLLEEQDIYSRICTGRKVRATISDIYKLDPIAYFVVLTLEEDSILFSCEKMCPSPEPKVCISPKFCIDKGNCLLND